MPHASYIVTVSTRRFAVLDCEDAPRWLGHDQNWIDLLRREGDVWHSFPVWAGELPERPGAYDAYVLSGSHHSVNDATQAWLAPLFDFVAAAARSPDTRVFGACFGLQVITTALGGRVEDNPGGRFAFGSERIAFERGEALTLLESHAEQATQLPPGARRLARSPTAENEMFSVGDRVLAVQFHAEFTPDMLREKILPRLRDEARLTPDEEARALTSLDAPLDSARFIPVIRRFLG
jgi:GMP synthase-like glutamine amidotransferase